MRLTAELIKGSLSYNNPLGERELDLRGHKIPAIENLGVAKDQECLDLTDNNLAQLNNFPTSPRLQTLLCAQNRIATLADNLPKSLPNLHTLVLTQNNVAELADLDVLKGFANLTYVTLMGNPVASKENYRYWILSRNPHIRFLDFQKVKDAERKQAKELFGTPEEPTEMAKSIMASRSSTSALAPGQATANGGKAKNFKATEEERKRFQALVQKAKSLAEIQKLEKLFNEGRLPPGMMDGDSMDET